MHCVFCRTDCKLQLRVIRALEVKGSSGDKGLWKRCTKLTQCLICHVLSSYEIIFLHVSKVSLLSFTMDKRIKVLKKLYSVLGNLTNSVCISVPAASFILFFFWVTGQAERLLLLQPFLHTVIFPLLKYLQKKKKYIIAVALVPLLSHNLCFSPINILEMEMHHSFSLHLHPNKNLEMETFTVPSLVLGQGFSCSLVNM